MFPESILFQSSNLPWQSPHTRHPTLKHEVPSNAALHKKLCIFGPNENNTYLGVKLFKRLFRCSPEELPETMINANEAAQDCSTICENLSEINMRLKFELWVNSLHGQTELSL
jgi:hypothetical protein